MLMPVTFSTKAFSTPWQAYFDLQGLDLHKPSIFISCPASASVGCYSLELCVSSQGKWRRCMIGTFILLCNPWCSGERWPIAVRWFYLMCRQHWCSECIIMPCRGHGLYSIRGPETGVHPEWLWVVVYGHSEQSRDQTVVVWSGKMFLWSLSSRVGNMILKF